MKHFVISYLFNIPKQNDPLMELWSAFSIGLFGSLHCLGMCGPIAMALPFQAASRQKTIWNALLYNLGRIVSYALLGVIPGILGYSLYLAGLQQGLSVLTGIVLLLSLLFSINLEYKIWQIKWLRQTGDFVQNQLGKRLQTKKQKTFLAAGLLNGLLPCGLVYLAFAGAFTQSSISDSMLYMATFGLGTLPMMLAMSLSFQLIKPAHRIKARKLMPFFIFAMGLFFIFRGLSVDLPGDIRMWLAKGAAPFCH